MRKSAWTFVVLIFAVVTACNKPAVNFEGGDPNYHAEEQAFLEVKQVKRPLPPRSSDSDGIGRKLLKEGSISFQADDIRKTHTFIAALCREHNAYISSESQNNYSNRLQQDLTVRIPAEQFDVYIKKLEEHAVSVENKSIEVKDVTEEFIDVEARLRTKKELELRYRDLLKQARTVSEVISVEAQLSNVRAEIESMEGRLKYLNDRVSLSILNITFYEVIGTDFGFGSKSIAALDQGWDNLLAFLISVLYLWPFILLIAATLYLLARWRKRKKIMTEAHCEGSGLTH